MTTIPFQTLAKITSIAQRKTRTEEYPDYRPGEYGGHDDAYDDGSEDGYIRACRDILNDLGIDYKQ